MPFQAVLREIAQLRNVGTRLETLAEQHPFLSEALTTVAGSVRNTAALLEVLVAIRGPETFSKVSNIDLTHRRPGCLLNPPRASKTET